MSIFMSIFPPLSDPAVSDFNIYLFKIKSAQWGYRHNWENLIWPDPEKPITIDVTRSRKELNNAYPENIGCRTEDPCRRIS
jgi:hypothetical protein